MSGAKNKLRLSRYLFLVKRGPQPIHQASPYHRVILCSNRKIARLRAGWSGDLSSVWEKDSGAASGFLVRRWNGLDIDYGGLVRGHILPDGSKSGFYHDRDSEPWTLLSSAVWWSTRNRVPGWLDGVVLPPSDSLSIQEIEEDEDSLSRGELDIPGVVW